MKTVVVFGTFDPLHDGHRSFLRQAAAVGDTLTVVAARDSYIQIVKKRLPRVPAAQRQAALLAEEVVHEFVWGDEWPPVDVLRLLGELDFDVLALGYDQEPADDVVRDWLAAVGKSDVSVIRLAPFEEATFKSSRL